MEEEREITSEDWGEPKSDPLAKIMKIKALVRELGLSPEACATKIRTLNDIEEEEGLAMSSVTTRPAEPEANPYTQYAKFEENAMQAAMEEPSPSAEELLDSAIGKMREIDKEMEYLQISRDNMEEQAIKASETLLLKCINATGAFRMHDILQETTDTCHLILEQLRSGEQSG